MAKYRKKPVVIEAEQFFPTKKPWPEEVEQYERERTETAAGPAMTHYGWRIVTLEGPMEVTPGDWIITGVKGERYPCKPDIFRETYEAAEKAEEHIELDCVGSAGDIT